MTPSIALAGLSYAEADRSGRSAGFIVLLAFVCSFLFIRTSARMIRAQVKWWPGNVETDSGLHLHHLVWGISLMIISGFAGFAMSPTSPWYQLAAMAFGIGCGLTLDEFALWVRLEDVYWTEQGRLSLDAVILVVAFMGLVVIGFKPFGVDEVVGPAATALVVAEVLVFCVIAFFKGRIGMGIVGIFIPGVAIWASCRLAHPTSPWARRFYKEGKIERAQKRFPPDRRGLRVRDAFFNAIGGKVSTND